MGESTALHRHLKTILGSSVKSERPVGGGCISRASLLTLQDGTSYFLKTNTIDLAAMFQAEALGLEQIRNVGVLRTPNIVTFGKCPEAQRSFLVLESISSGSKGPTFDRDFGRRFAEFHQAGAGDRFGFEEDNFIGSTQQVNDWSQDWASFWAEHRIGFQVRLAKDRNLLNAQEISLLELATSRFSDLVGNPDEPPCLLHGDLWGGNYMVDLAGAPVLIDPAAYYGRREADLAMTLLFGEFGPDFYRGYEEVWPLASGKEERLEIYKLYHLLNHLNLFGNSYKAQCLSIARKYC